MVATEFKDYVDITDVKIANDLSKLLPVSAIRSQWVDFQNHKSYLFYVLGAQDDTAFARPESAVEEITEEMKAAHTASIVDNQYVHYGRVEADAIMLSELH